MRDGYDAAVAHRVNLAVFAGNTGYWQVRFEGSRLGRDHVMVCYREPAEDPERRLAPSTVTVEWRDPLLHRPESQLLGAMWIGFFANDLNHPGFPWVVRDAVPWLFAGTGLKPGESVPKMVGYEYDAVVPGAPTPPNMHVISASPVETDTGKKQVANSTLATAYSGARIFNAGTIQWSWGLDDFGPLHLAHNRRGGTSRQVQRITKNLFAAFRTRGVALPTVRVRVHGKRKGTSFVAPVRVYLNATHGAAWIRYRLGAGRVWQRYRAPLSVRSAGDVALQSEAVTSHGDHGPVRNTRLHVTR
jgi:hypothetical protein